MLFPTTEELTVTEGVMLETSTTVMDGETAINGLAQGSLEVICTVTWSPLASVFDV